jgi:hydrogenase-4 component F
MQPALSWIVILNLLIPLLVVLVVLLCRAPIIGPRLVRALPARWFDRFTLAVSLVCLVLSGLLVIDSSGLPVEFSLPLPLIGPIDFRIDALSVYFMFVVNVIALFASWHVLASPPIRRPLYFNFFVNLFHVTMLLVPVVDNLIILWIAVESTTLVSTLLVSVLDRRNPWEAAWKYLMVTSTGIVFGLLGTMFLANAAKSLLPLASADPNQVMNWSFLMEHADQLSEDFVVLSFLFILVGYGTKAGFAPMHTWLPDGHGEAPAPISALLSGVLLKSALFAILRFSTLTNQAQGNAALTSGLLLGIGVISLTLATPFILNPRNRFKRVLAYHSLEHMGIIAFGLGIGGSIALFGALLHVLNHALTKSLMFLAFGNVINRYPRLPGEGISDALRRMPSTGLILAIGGLALVGTPPFNIFLSELIILWGALTNRDAIIPSWVMHMGVVLFMISTTLIFYGLVRHLAGVLLPSHGAGHQPAPAAVAGTVDAISRRETFKEISPLVVLAVIVVVSGLVIWTPLVTTLNQCVAVLLGI